MNAPDLTRDFARTAGGYTGASPAMLRAMEAIRQTGIRKARQAHAERYAVLQQYKDSPALFFAYIRPALSTDEAVEDATRIICRFRNLPTWKQAYGQREVVEAKRKRVFARFFRRYGARLWLREAA